MKKIVAGLSVIGMALSLAACGTNTTNDTAANEALANETVLNDELPVDANLGDLGNGEDAALLDNAATENVAGADANAL